MEGEEIKIVTPKFQKTVEDLIKNLSSENGASWEIELARKLNALPTGQELWSFILLTPNGEIIDQDFDGNIQHYPFDLQALIRVLVGGSKRYPQLVQFIPSRPDDSKTCPVCEGSGIWEQSKDISTGRPAKCFICAGLGWLNEDYWKVFTEIQKELKNHK